MIEAIALMSALYTIGKAGLNLYDTLTIFAEGITNAKSDIGFVVFEIKSTSEIFLLIRDSLKQSKDSRSNIVKEGRLILEGLAAQCEFCYDLIKELISYLQPYLDESQSSASKDLVRWGQRPKHVKFLEKWRWWQQKPKFDKLRRYLEGLKSNLGLLLPILQFEIAEERRAPSFTLCVVARSKALQLTYCTQRATERYNRNRIRRGKMPATEIGPRTGPSSGRG